MWEREKEIRNSNIEIRNIAKGQISMGKSETDIVFKFGILNLFRNSDFVLRILIL